MRNLIDVIDNMLLFIPEKEKCTVSALKDIRESNKTRAPEDMLGWYEVNNMVMSWFAWNKRPKYWQMAVCSVFSTTPMEQIQTECSWFKSLKAWFISHCVHVLQVIGYPWHEEPMK